MNDALLIELADCGSPEKLIQVILSNNSSWSTKVPLEELASDVGIEGVELLHDKGFEGALVSNENKTKGVIFVREGRSSGRRRFTIAHELGHFLIPSHKGNQQCTKQDLQETRRDTQHQRKESEANRFSAGLLMPKPWVLRDLKRKGGVDLRHLQSMKETYETSFEATANRVIELTDEQCAIVFSQNGVVRYIRTTAGFPWLAVKAGSSLPRMCSSISAPDEPLRQPSTWHEHDGAVWLETKRGLSCPSVQEQWMRQANGFQVTLLTVEAAAEDDDDAEDDQLVDSWTPRFHR